MIPSTRQTYSASKIQLPAMTNDSGSRDSRQSLDADFGVGESNKSRGGPRTAEVKSGDYKRYTACDPVHSERACDKQQEAIDVKRGPFKSKQRQGSLRKTEREKEGSKLGEKRESMSDDGRPQLADSASNPGAWNAFSAADSGRDATSLSDKGPEHCNISARHLVARGDESNAQIPKPYDTRKRQYQGANVNPENPIRAVVKRPHEVEERKGGKEKPVTTLKLKWTDNTGTTFFWQLQTQEGKDTSVTSGSYFSGSEGPGPLYADGRESGGMTPASKRTLLTQPQRPGGAMFDVSRGARATISARGNKSDTRRSRREQGLCSPRRESRRLAGYTPEYERLCG
ncbi:hypothetical protein I7I48_01531 [Histoplasma ohiense]|nr:hypothetical protein I7I48_01531 [Histoplasma ohiense (nom. inval.)]